MTYTFQFVFVWRELDHLLLGAWLTIRLAAGAMLLGLVVGIACARAKTSRSRLLRGLVDLYVEAIRNTPFLMQLLLIYLGLPSLGLRLNPNQAALLAMVVNVGAYATEILRAGIESVPVTQIEAGRSLGLKPWQVFRFVVLIPALRAVFPALGSQFILMMLASSVVSVISAEELTAVTDLIVARNFRSFEFYLVTTGIYLAMSFAFQAIFALIDRLLFALEPPRMIREFGLSDILFLIAAARWTVLLSFIAFIGGGVGGLIVALLRVAHLALLRGVALAFIKVFQGTPLLMQLYLVYFGANLFGVGTDPWLSVALALTLYPSAFLGEIWRGCIEAVPRGQWEGARALALGYFAQLRFVILPQALRIAVPPTVGFLVQLLKGTSLASIIGFVELTRAAQMVNNATFRPFTVYLLVTSIYFALCWPLSHLSRRLEKRLGEQHLPTVKAQV